MSDPNDKKRQNNLVASPKRAQTRWSGVKRLFSAERAAIELSPAFQSGGSGHAVARVAERRLRLIDKLNTALTKLSIFGSTAEVAEARRGESKPLFLCVPLRPLRLINAMEYFVNTVLNRRSATVFGCAFLSPALTSRAKLTWPLRDRGNGYRVITNATNKLSHSPTRNRSSLYRVKFKRQIEGGKYGDKEHINSNQTEHRLHHGRRHRLVQHRRISPGHDGRSDSEPRPDGR